MALVQIRIRSIPCGQEGIYKPGQRYAVPEDVAYALMCAKLADLDDDSPAHAPREAFLRETATLDVSNHAVAHQTGRGKLAAFFHKLLHTNACY